MPVYLFTYHAYRSWNPDHPRGFVQTGRGIQAPNQTLARAYDNIASQSPAIFAERHQQILIWIGYDFCARRNWQLHFIATEPTHAHFLLSWNDETQWPDASQKLKNLAALALCRKLDTPGRRWFSKGSSRKRVRDRQHFDHLVDSYLPKHSGLSWREGNSPPTEPLPLATIPKKPSASAGG